MNEKKIVIRNHLSLLILLCAITTQKSNNFSETQLQKSPNSAFKLVHDAMKIGTVQKSKSRTSSTSSVIVPSIQGKSKKSPSEKTSKEFKIKTRPAKIRRPSPAVKTDPYVPLVISKIPESSDKITVNPKPRFAPNFGSNEQNFLHEVDARITPLLAEKDETFILVHEDSSPLKQLEDDIDTLWSQKAYVTRRVVDVVSSCGSKSSGSHLTEDGSQIPAGPLVTMVENLYREISPGDNEKDKEIAMNIIGILKAYTTYEEDKPEDEKPAIVEILKIDTANLCSSEQKDSQDIKTPQKLICAIEAQKKILGDLLSPYDLQVLTITEKLLEEWLIEGGDSFYSKSKEIQKTLNKTD